MTVENHPFEPSRYDAAKCARCGLKADWFWHVVTLGWPDGR